jgi:hypothetical protein
MSVQAYLYVSRDDQEAVHFDSTPDSFLDCEKYTSFTSLELSTLWAGVRGVAWDVNLLDEFPAVLQRGGGERSICRLPHAMVSEMAPFGPPEIETAAINWAATEEMRCEPVDVQPIIQGLVRLAKIASETGRNIYFWNCV